MAINFQGTIDARGYTPVPKTLNWMRGTLFAGSTTLNPNGKSRQERWYDNRTDLYGAVAEAWHGKEGGVGVAAELLIKLFGIYGILRDPTLEERQEFAWCNVPEKQYRGMTIEQGQAILGDPTWHARELAWKKKGGEGNPLWVDVDDRYAMVYIRAGVFYQNVRGSQHGEKAEIALPPWRPGDVQPLPGEGTVDSAPSGPGSPEARLGSLLGGIDALLANQNPGNQGGLPNRRWKEMIADLRELAKLARK